MRSNMLKPIQFNLRAASRRQVLWIAGSSLAAGVVASAAPVISEQYPGDLEILNVALGLEHQAIAAYNAGAGSKLLTPISSSWRSVFREITNGTATPSQNSCAASA